MTAATASGDLVLPSPASPIDLILDRWRTASTDRNLTDVVIRGHSDVLRLLVDRATALTDIAESTAAAERPLPLVPPRRLPPPPPTAHFRALQQWEGRVVERRAHSFAAILYDLTDRQTEEDVEVDLVEVSDEDHDLIEPGAIFYWTIGYKTEPSGERSRASLILFRRLPAWTENDVKRLAERTHDLRRAFGLA